MTDKAAQTDGDLFRPILTDNLFVGVVNQITQSILAGTLRPGDQLPTENELAQQFGVSRTVVREAIKALSLQGLVQVATRRGTVITRPPVDTVANSLKVMLHLEDHVTDDFMVARLILEVPNARLAATQATSENIDRLGAALDRMRATINNPEIFFDHDMAFHAELAHATQMPVLSVLLRPVIETIRTHLQTLVRVPGETERAVLAHEQIYQAVTRREPDTAETNMRAHLLLVARDTAQAREAALAARGTRAAE